MFRFRIYRTHREVLLAVSDEELIGRTLRASGIVVHITEQFYGTEVADEADLRDLLHNCTVANLMGKRCIALATELGFVQKDRVLEIENVPHAQLARM